jgi:8-oxo-dGTP pyrophosphatase MutT (NUDIX family)/phosphohistidine phosphatase SixA
VRLVVVRDAKDVLSAGVVVFRPGKQVLLVHRPKSDDWSFPKGKIDRGEHATTAAVREVAEETGLRVRLGPPLSDQRYPVAQGRKTVHYWVGRPVGDDDVSGYQANNEIDEVAWVPVDKAARRLTYTHDQETLREALAVRKTSVPLVVLRHGVARARKTWRADDRERPLLQAGQLQARHLAPVLAAYDVRRVVSSSSTRCVQTVAPYARDTGQEVEETDRLSEEDATPTEVRRVVQAAVEAAVDGRHGVALCSHRKVLPAVFEAVGLADPELEKGELLVVHLRHGHVIATERHLVR